ncbi:MAG: tRNA lysidine(34) synthetase TilS [Spirochaetia bacterium]|nr:tRNA lysidine(34) synthetase TilS [Spirochaetia bacterium]
MSLEHLLKIQAIEPHETKALIENDWILSFSGGADSTLCLYYLSEFARKHKLKNKKLIIYYVDHNINYSSSISNKREAVFKNAVKILNNNVKYSWHIIKKNIPEISKRYKKGLEHASSRIRRKYLDILRRQNESAVTVFGHSLSDWYETLIMRINRGASRENLNPFGVFENNLGYIEFRPLSGITREEVRKVLKEKNINYWDDPENQNMKYLRNQIRTQAPILNAEGLRKSFENFTLNSKEENKKIQNLVHKLKEETIEIKKNREYRILYNTYSNLSTESRQWYMQYYLKKLGYYAFTSAAREKLKQIPFHKPPYHIEIENWHNNIYLVVRRGQKTLNYKKPQIKNINVYDIIKAEDITKKYFISLSFGKKSVKKILSEKKLSTRQRSNMYLPLSKENGLKILQAPLSVYDIKDINSVDK